MSESAPAVLVHDLVKEYSGRAVVGGVSFDVARGEVFALLGPNGAGKTTTFLSLTRQIPVTSGRVSLLGHDVSTDFASVKPRFGYVPDVENHFDQTVSAVPSRTRLRFCLS